MTPDRIACPRCRQDLVRRLQRARAQGLPDFPMPPASARFWGAGAAAYVFAAAAILSTAVGVYATYQQSQYQQAQQEASYIAQAQALQYNAQMQQQQAAYAAQLGEIEAGALERQALGVESLAAQENNIALQQARAAQTAGNIREQGIRSIYTKTQSDVRAQIGRSGVDTTGSPLLVLLKNAESVGQELAVNDYQTALDVYGAKTSGSMAVAEGNMRADSLRQEIAYRRFGAQAAAAGAMGQAGLYTLQANNLMTAGQSASRYAGATRGLDMGTSLLRGLANAASPFIRYGYGT